MSDTRKIENVKIVLNELFEIADAETIQRDLTKLFTMAMASPEFESLGNVERANVTFRFLKCQKMIGSPRKDADPGRAILVISGRLNRVITAIPGENFTRITISNHVPCAKYHNEGTKILPQRQFIGESKSLNNKIRRVIKATIAKIFY